jgi:hypothetical protein
MGLNFKMITVLFVGRAWRAGYNNTGCLYISYTTPCISVTNVTFLPPILDSPTFGGQLHCPINWCDAMWFEKSLPEFSDGYVTFIFRIVGR